MLGDKELDKGNRARNRDKLDGVGTDAGFRVLFFPRFLGLVLGSVGHGPTMRHSSDHHRAIVLYVDAYFRDFRSDFDDLPLSSPFSFPR